MSIDRYYDTRGPPDFISHQFYYPNTQAWQR